ncbi:MAG: hypothetical protein EZS28_015700 [Streblomastix strix]|uniref:Uncharacterized protein n=1 Tax=Streblomastix strix TaxID=222440 RepID=A0A5J4W2M7_9EUKA|nr:MAG: hypothetical protein EZS28_015700 [Streblomastix strix]
MHDTPSAHTYRVISNCNVQTRRYAHVWYIDILFNHRVRQPTDQIFTNQDLQIKLASLLQSVCFLIISEIPELDLIHSNFNIGYQTAIVTLSPNSASLVVDACFIEYAVKPTIPTFLIRKLRSSEIYAINIDFHYSFRNSEEKVVISQRKFSLNRLNHEKIVTLGQMFSIPVLRTSNCSKALVVLGESVTMAV